MAVLDFGDAKADGTGDLYGAPSHTPDASLVQVGAVYGVAYASGTNAAAPAQAQQQPAVRRRLYQEPDALRTGRPRRDLPDQSFDRGGEPVCPGAECGARPCGGAARPGRFPNTPGDGSQATFWNVSYE